METLAMTKRYRRCSKSMKLSHQEALKLQIDFECLLLAMLSPQYKMVLTNPQKKTKTKLQFIKVKELIQDQLSGNPFVFDIQKFIKKRSLEMALSQTQKGVSYVTALRRIQDLKHIETIHLFEDLLGENYIFEVGFEDRDGIHGNVNVFRDLNLMYSISDIKRIGSQVCLYLYSKLSSNDMIITPNELTHFLSM